MTQQTKLEHLKSLNNKYGENMNIHESCLRAFNVLKLTKEMIERGDSKETILLVLDYLGY